MANDIKIGGSATGGIDALKEALGLNPRGGGAAVTSSSSGASSSAGGRGGYGPRGMRMLPADVPVESLDRNAAPGTYIDILI
ncbi:MAG TPA: hypothetical protein VLL76_00255 [Candidatus Omnitrophota bacterium]|nr:hypothetical protein [Candidatus Omnitrophota bacterium]